MSQKWVSTNGMANLCFPNKWFHWLSDPSTAPASRSDGDELKTIMTVGVYPDPSNSNQKFGGPSCTRLHHFTSRFRIPVTSMLPQLWFSVHSTSGRLTKPFTVPSWDAEPSIVPSGWKCRCRSCRGTLELTILVMNQWWEFSNSCWQILFPQTPAPKKTSTWLRLKIQKQSQQIPGFMFQFSLFTSPFSEVYTYIYIYSKYSIYHYIPHFQRVISTSTSTAAPPDESSAFCRCLPGWWRTKRHSAAWRPAWIPSSPASRDAAWSPAARSVAWSPAWQVAIVAVEWKVGGYLVFVGDSYIWWFVWGMNQPIIIWLWDGMGVCFMAQVKRTGMLAAFRTGIVRKPQGDSLFRSQVEVALGKASCIIPSPLGLGIICTPSKWIAFAPMDQGEGSVRRASRLWIWPNRCTYVNESNRKQPFGTSDWRWGVLFSTMDLPRTKLGCSALAIHHAANLQVSTSSHSKRRTASCRSSHVW